MLTRKYAAIILALLFFISVLNTSNYISAAFEQSEEDVENWSKSIAIVDFYKDEYFKFNLPISDSTGEYVLIMYLSFHTILNLPLEVISYLNHNKRDQTANFGIHINTNQGNFSLGINGTIIVDTPYTDPIFIEVKEGEQQSIANFSSFLGENLTIPINFIPFVFPIEVSNIYGIDGLKMSFTPFGQMNGSSSIQTRILDQNLIISDSHSIYVDSFTVDNDFQSFSTEMRDIYLDLVNVSLSIKTFDVAFVLKTELGDLIKTFTVDFSLIDTSVILNPLMEFLLFYVSSTFYLGNLTLTVDINSTPFPVLSFLIALVVSYGLIYWKNRRKKEKHLFI